MSTHFPFGSNDTQPMLPFDVCAGKHRANSESRAANLKISKAESREQVMRVLLGSGPMTCKEIASRLGKEMHTISGRITELKALGMVEPTTELRDGGRVIRVRRTA